MTDSVAWAADAYAALNLTWRAAPSRHGARALGTTADQAALMDVTIKHDRLIGASAVVPIKPEYTLMLTFLLASLVKDATMAEADAWLARQLRRLPQRRVGDVSAFWYQWRVVLTTNALGLLTMRVR